MGCREGGGRPSQHLKLHEHHHQVTQISPPSNRASLPSIKLGCRNRVFSFICDDFGDGCDARIDRESAELRERARREGWWGGDQARMINVHVRFFGAGEIALSGPFTSYDKCSVCAN